MTNGLFLSLLFCTFAPLLFLACRVLPGEKWQIAAAIPTRKEMMDGQCRWRGCNLTFYGILLATGGCLGVLVFAFLLAAAGHAGTTIIFLSGVILFFSVIAAKVIARVVEKKKNTLTVAGAATTGLFLAPLAVFLHNRFLVSGSDPILLMPVMAALSTGYLIGEGTGRLACLSFGCCYGKPLATTGKWMQRLLTPIACTYQGETKKISYASGLSGVPVVPVQALTSFFFVVTGLVGIHLYLNGRSASAFGLTAIFAMTWRLLSERWRADYRGQSRFSAYQIMGLINIVFILFLLLILPATPVKTLRFQEGLAALWTPWTLLSFQGLWLALFLRTGLSRVTGSTISFHVRHEEI
ncbi:MAG: prolipoprotein diacylglyceryl transferase family protein [Thermodesulfobacteriota bacterium]